MIVTKWGQRKTWQTRGSYSESYFIPVRSGGADYFVEARHLTFPYQAEVSHNNCDGFMLNSSSYQFHLYDKSFNLLYSFKNTDPYRGDIVADGREDPGSNLCAMPDDVISADPCFKILYGALRSISNEDFDVITDCRYIIEI